MMHKLQAISGAALLLLLPLVTFAITAVNAAGIPIDGAGNPIVGAAPVSGGVAGALFNISNIANSLIPLLITIAVVVFLWGLVRYLFKVGGEEGAKGGAQIMIWSIVVFFVMVSIWGLVALLQTTLGVGSQSGIRVANPDNLRVQ